MVCMAGRQDHAAGEVSARAVGQRLLDLADEVVEGIDDVRLDEDEVLVPIVQPQDLCPARVWMPAEDDQATV